jgi:hypothetical protein
MSWCDLKCIEYSRDGYRVKYCATASRDTDKKELTTDIPFYEQNYYYKLGIDCISKNPARIITKLLSIVDLFHSKMFPVRHDIKYSEELITIYKILNILLAIIAGATSLLLLRKGAYKYITILLLLPLSLAVTVYLQIEGEERYLIPYSPIFFILALPSILQVRKIPLSSYCLE